MNHLHNLPKNTLDVNMAGGDKPGANSRGRGGKFRKFTRGGGKHFSRDLRPLDADGNEISMWSKDARKKDDDSDEEEDSDESEEESEEDSEDSDAPKASGALSREEKKAEKKAKKDAAIRKAKGQAVQVGDMPPSDSEEDSDDADMPSNPNHSKAARSQTKAPVNKGVDEVTAGVAKMRAAAPANRKERESLEAQQAKERYRKMHEAGKTDEAKADLARLKLIREKREAEAARKQAEKEEREEQEKAKRAEIEAKEAKKREAALGPKAAKKGKK